MRKLRKLITVILFVLFSISLTNCGLLSSAFFEFNESSGTITGYNDYAPKDVVIPKKINGVDVKIIGTNAFSEKNITSVVIPNTVEVIDTQAFSKNRLKNIDIPNSVQKIGVSAFSFNELTTVSIPSSVEKISMYSFYQNDIKSAYIPSSVKEIYVNSWGDSVPLSRVNLKEYLVFYGDVLITYDDATFNLKNVYVGEDFEFNRFTKTITGYKMSAPKDVIIPNEINGVPVENIGKEAFYWKNIKSVSFPKTIKNIEEDAFKYNEIVNLKIPSSIKNIEMGAFTLNPIETVELPKNFFINRNVLSDDEDILFIDENTYKVYKLKVNNEDVTLINPIINVYGTTYIEKVDFSRATSTDLKNSEKEDVHNFKFENEEYYLKYMVDPYIYFGKYKVHMFGDNPDTFNYDGKMYVKLRYTAETLNYNVNWDGENNTVLINY